MTLEWTATVALLLIEWQDRSFEELIERLGHDDPRVRDGAEARLIRVAGDHLPALKTISQTDPDPEIRSRVANVVERFTQVQWRDDLAAALEEARRTSKPLLVFSVPADRDAPI